MGEWDGRVRRLAQQHAGVITLDELLASGISRASVYRQVKEGLWRTTPFPSVFLVPHLHVHWFSELAAAAIGLVGAACGRAGAALWKLDGFDDFRGELSVITSRDRRCDVPNLVVTLARWVDDRRHFTVRDGVRVLKPAMLLASLGERVSIDELEGAMDHVLRARWSSWEELEAAASELAPRFRRGAVMLRDAIARRSPQRRHTDSLLETKCVQLLRDGGLPDPVLQYEVFDGSRRLGAADLAFPEHDLLIETVGVKAHRSDLWQYSVDCRRFNGIILLNRRWRMLHYTWEQVTRRPEQVLADVARALGIPQQIGLELMHRPGGPGLLRVSPPL